jgi:hypothetical protein
LYSWTWPIPRLIQQIIDQGITQHNQTVVLHTALWMLAISALGTVFAVGNNDRKGSIHIDLARNTLAVGH